MAEHSYARSKQLTRAYLGARNAVAWRESARLFDLALKAPSHNQKFDALGLEAMV